MNGLARVHLLSRVRIEEHSHRLSFRRVVLRPRNHGRVFPVVIPVFFVVRIVPVILLVATGMELFCENSTSGNNKGVAGDDEESTAHHDCDEVT